MQYPNEDQKVTFIEGITTMMGAGNPVLKVITMLSYHAIEWNWNSCVCMQCQQ